MFTTMAVIALSALTAGNVASAPVWLDDYRVAQAQVGASGKPMAVFVGSGKAGWGSVVGSTALDPAVSKLLSEKFVCLYVDTTTQSGRSLAVALQVADRGLVISDKSGRSQAYSASGSVSPVEMQRALIAYANQTEVRTTEVQSGSVITTQATAPVAGPAPVYVGGPGYMGGSGYMGSPGGCSTGMYGGGGYGMGHGCCGMFGGGGWGFGSGHKGGGGCSQPTGCGGAPALYASSGSCGGHSSCCGFGGFLSGCGLGMGGGGGWGHGGGFGGGCCGFGHGGGCK